MKHESATLPPMKAMRMKDYSSVYRKIEERSNRHIEVSIERV